MNNKQIITDFFEKVRSGKNLNLAYKYMQDNVLAHQIIAESKKEIVIRRTPEDYAEHVNEMRKTYGEFSLSIEEILSDDNKVYVRWRQLGSVKGKPITEIGSAVYMVRNAKISEYWIQLDRKGIEEQMKGLS